MAEKMRVQLILEVLGKPKEYVYEVLEKLKEKIGEENGVTISTCSIGEPKEIKDANDFYTGFLDIEIEVEKLDVLFGMCFKYMPSHIDLIYPENISLSNSQLNELLNFLTTKLHGYDEVARVLQIQNEKLEKEIRDLRDKK